MKIKRIIVAVVMMMTCIGALPITTYASVRDSTIPSSFVSYSQWMYTSSRNKDDYSYVYVKNTAGFDFYLQVLSGNVNCTGSGHAIVPSSAERFVTNYVKERNFSNCRLHISSARSGVSGYTRGAWSPDSVGSYPVANP